MIRHILLFFFRKSNYPQFLSKKRPIKNLIFLPESERNAGYRVPKIVVLKQIVLWWWLS